MPGEVGKPVAVEIGDLALVGSHRVDEAALPGAREGGVAGEPIEVDLRVGVRAEVPAAEVRLADEHLVTTGGVEVDRLLGVHGEQRPCVDLHCRPGLRRRIRRRDEGVHLPLRAFREERREDVQPAVVIQVEHGEVRVIAEVGAAIRPGRAHRRERVAHPARAGVAVPAAAGDDVRAAVAVDVADPDPHHVHGVDHAARPQSRRRRSRREPEHPRVLLIDTHSVQGAVAVEIAEGEVVGIRGRDEDVPLPATGPCLPEPGGDLAAAGVLTGHDIHAPVAVDVLDEGLGAHAVLSGRDLPVRPGAALEPADEALAADDDVVGAVTVDVPHRQGGRHLAAGVDDVAGERVDVETIGATNCGTTAVGWLSAAPDPPGLVAVTRTRSVDPISAAVTTYVDAVAPVMSPQVPPRSSQRRHRYAKLAGFPDHEPLPAVRVWPTWAAPETVGGVVFAGGDEPVGCTTAVVGSESAGSPGPAALEAVTRTRIVAPTSAAWRTYVVDVAAAMSAQAVPDVSQRRHW